MRSKRLSTVDAHKPLVDCVEPLVDANEPLINRVKPLVDAHKPLVGHVKPLVDDHEPLVDRVEPLVDQVKPALEERSQLGQLAVRHAPMSTVLRRMAQEWTSRYTAAGRHDTLGP